MSTIPEKKIARIEMPPCVAELEVPHRYYVLYGGRNGVKSWSVARHLLIRGIQEPIRVLCCRETMITIADSVHALLELQIKLLELGAYYDVQKSAVYGLNGTRFVYAGLRGLKHDKTALKSYESFDIAWVEEAESVSKDSWSILIPTIRKAGSRIYVIFNPHLETDNTYVRFLQQTPPNCALIPTNYRDNPWLSDEAWADMMHLKETDPDEFDHIYEGKCVKRVKGAVFNKELEKMDEEHRICQVSVEPFKPVETFWDIGDRYTAIWFGQEMPFQTRLVDFMMEESLGLKEIVRSLRERDYTYGPAYLPFDAKSPQLGTGKTIEEQLRGYGFTVKIIPKLSVSSRINAARTIFPKVWIDSEKCADGIQGLRHYRWPKEGADGQLQKKPLHDWASHPGDAFTHLAVAIRGYVPEEEKPVDPVDIQNQIVGVSGNEQGWMQ